VSIGLPSLCQCQLTSTNKFTMGRRQQQLSRPSRQKSAVFSSWIFAYISLLLVSCSWLVQCVCDVFIERAQSDPYAFPTRCLIVVETIAAGFPITTLRYLDNPIRYMALSDYLLRILLCLACFGTTIGWL
jgi:hypothetical protein